MPDVIERLAAQHGLILCVECGKCVAACPMGRIFPDLTREASPRGVIERVLRDLDVPADGRLWFCLTCNLCADLCPAGVRFRDFVEAVRWLTIEAGSTEHGSFCRQCGAYLCPQHTMEYLKHRLGEAAGELLTLCPRCRQYDFGEKVRALDLGGRTCAQRASTGEDR